MNKKFRKKRHGNIALKIGMAIVLAATLMMSSVYAYWSDTLNVSVNGIVKTTDSAADPYFTMIPYTDAYGEAKSVYARPDSITNKATAWAQKDDDNANSHWAVHTDGAADRYYSIDSNDNWRWNAANHARLYNNNTKHVQAAAWSIKTNTSFDTGFQYYPLKQFTIVVRLYNPRNETLYFYNSNTQNRTSGEGVQVRTQTWSTSQNQRNSKASLCVSHPYPAENFGSKPSNWDSDFFTDINENVSIPPNSYIDLYFTVRRAYKPWTQVIFIERYRFSVHNSACFKLTNVKPGTTPPEGFTQYKSDWYKIYFKIANESSTSHAEGNNWTGAPTTTSP